jgi:hypothetical protein
MLQVVTAAPAKQTGQEQLLMVTPTMTVYATLTKSEVAPIQQHVTTMRTPRMTMALVPHWTLWEFAVEHVLRMLTAMEFATMPTIARTQQHATTAILPMKLARALHVLAARLYRPVITTI